MRQREHEFRGPNHTYRVSERRNMFGKWVWAVWEQTAPNSWNQVFEGTHEEATEMASELAGMGKTYLHFKAL